MWTNNVNSFHSFCFLLLLPQDNTFHFINLAFSRINFSFLCPSHLSSWLSIYNIDLYFFLSYFLTSIPKSISIWTNWHSTESVAHKKKKTELFYFSLTYVMYWLLLCFYFYFVPIDFGRNSDFVTKVWLMT